MSSHDEDRFAQEWIARAGRPKCPDHVVANILAAVDAEQRRRRLSPTRLVWIASAAAAAILLALLPGRFRLEPAPPSTLTQAEIDATRAELEQAFSIISQSMSHTTHIVDDQLRQNVTGRLLQGVLRAPAPAPAEAPAAPDSDQSRLDPQQGLDGERNDHA
jgi:hypothetical protein